MLKACPEQNEISRILPLEGFRIFKAPYENCRIPCLLKVFQIRKYFNFIFAII